MTNLKRRHFLQLAGSTMAALGLEQSNFFRQSEQYGKVLAQPTGRKIALLVGINKYPTGISTLRGCLSDVEMQRQLLIHRYGFNPKDILTVSDDSAIKPTRKNILQAFEDQLIGKVKPGDVALFHYSGHGSRVLDSRPIPLPNAPDNQLNGTLLAYDSRSMGRARGVNDIMGKTLFLLSQAVKTDNFTMVLDSCHSGGGTRGNLVFRSAAETRPGEAESTPSDTELDYQARWMSKLDLSEDKLFELRKAGIAKGMALGSAQANQLAADAVFNGFYAGAFSYLLTQYLWQLPGSEPVDRSFQKLALITNDVAGYNPQVPIYEVQKESSKQAPLYFLEPTAPAAEAVLAERTGDKVQYWMGGVSSRSLESYGDGSVFELIDAQGKPIGTIKQTGRQGLMGEGILQESQGKVGEGTLMREKIRGVPSDLSLKVGLDDSLGKGLKSQLMQALKGVQRLTPVVVDPQTPDQKVDFLLSRLTDEVQVQGQSRNVQIERPSNSVGLLSTSLTPIPDSFGTSAQESAGSVVSRLAPRFKMLLAGKILTSVVNSESSELKVDVQIRSLKRGGVVAAQQSRGDRADAFVPKRLTGLDNKVQAGDEIEIVISNHEARNLYIGALAISSKGELAILYPLDFEDPEAASLVAAGKSVSVPEKTGSEDDFHFNINGPAGFFELMVLASTEPLRDALKAMGQIARSRGLTRGNPLAFAEGTRAPGESIEAPVNIMQALLGDLNETTTRTGVTVSRGTQGVSSSGLAGFSSIIEVISPEEDTNT